MISSIELKAFERTAFEALTEASHIGLKYFRDQPLRYVKPDGSLVSQADNEIEHYVRNFLAQKTPDFGFIGEETGSIKKLSDTLRKKSDQKSEYEGLHAFEVGLNEGATPLLNVDYDTHWILDPIDGTVSFLSRSPLWSMLLALVVKGRPVVGVVLLPALDEVFIASLGNGARFGLASTFFEHQKKCFTRKTEILEEAHVSVSSPQYFSHRGIESWYKSLLNRHGDLRTHSDAYGQTRILCGGIDAQIDPFALPHDLAALQILFDETPGACLTSLQFESGPHRYRAGSCIAATNEKLVTEIKTHYLSHLDSHKVSGTGGFESFYNSFVLNHNQKPFEKVPSQTRLWARSIEQAVMRFYKQCPNSHVDDVSVIVSENQSYNIHAKNGKFDAPAKVRVTSGVAIRAIVDGATAMTNVSWPEEQPKVELIQETLNQAARQARMTNNTPGQRILGARDHVHFHVGQYDWGTIWDGAEFQSIAKKIASLHLEKIDDRIQTIESNISASSENRIQIFLNGSQHTITNLTLQAAHRVTAVENSEKRRAFNRIFETTKPVKKDFLAANLLSLHRTQKQAIDLIAAPFVPEDIHYDYLAIDADLLGLILHEAVGHASEGDLIATGQSGFGQDGQIQAIQMGPEWLNIVIDGALANCGINLIDAEGTLAKRKTLVQNGMLIDGIHTLETAFGAKSVADGSARFENIFYPWLNRMTSVWVQSENLRPLLMDPSSRASDLTADDVAKTLQQSEFLQDDKIVLYLSGWKGGTASCSNLEFRADVARVYLLKPGQKPQLMREANFTGIATECFKNVAAAFGPVLCRSVGMCGKDGQSVPTSDGGPAIMIMKKNDFVHVIGSGEAEA